MDSWKVAVLGDGSVGKTALSVKVRTYDPTIEDTYRKQFVVDNKVALMEITDTAGQEEYATSSQQWIRDCQGFLLVYSITSRSTFDRIEIFRQSMLRVKGPTPIFTLVGNKCDQMYAREVSNEEGAALARSFGCNFVETSAKTAHNLHYVFTSLVRTLRSAKPSDDETKRPKKKCHIF
ncbi:hypothetical protein FIBSPDRAFT_806351 [Athelia psychrophila]|uniref:Ras protein n=1 Tax=Athelia psychrophila TaxID=1759441 RepID=A0A167VAX9_9AGAM|nr:hypothetical protein FIBSPDRAFT_844435 [Fibularhizoctonia sp. CBS 109695]KZP04817.1 hypothetical protein FIBSPDRAFT_806351 [Fibularhizoctonia sp. CBS 109695]